MHIASPDVFLYYLGNTAFQAELTFPGATGREIQLQPLGKSPRASRGISAPSSRHNWVKISEVSGKTPICIHVGKILKEGSYVLS